MRVNNTQSLGANSSSETRSVFYCPNSPHFMWDLNDTTSLKIILAVTTIACPVTILLNLLIIIAVKTRIELKKNCNIALSSLAAADLLVGAVSMPLTITLDALVLQGSLSKDIFCTMDIISDCVLYTFFCASLFHLVLVAWERYVAIVKWMQYKVIVTSKRIKTYAAVAWLAALLTSPPVLVIEAVGVRYEVMLAVDIVLSIFWVFSFSFLIYCYVKIYLAVRNQNRTEISSVNALVRVRQERKIAYTTMWITLFVCISGVPTIIVYLIGRVAPVFRESSIFRWADTMLQLNSLVNPLLYFYRNRQLRKSALELFKCGRKPHRIHPAAYVRRTRRRRYSEASQNVEEHQIVQERTRLTRTESCDNVLCSDAVWRGSSDKVKERPTSAPSKIATPPNKQVVTVQIGNHDTVSPKDTMELERSRHHLVGKTVRSKSMNECSLFTLTDCLINAEEKNSKRFSSLPMLSTNLNTLDKKLTVSELISEKEPALNSYEQTKL